MTLATGRWPVFTGPPDTVRPDRRPGTLPVWHLELAKLARQIRVQVVAAVCVLAPFLVAAAVKMQSAVPDDTLFGQWIHESGFALPMVVLGFGGQWFLPLLTAIVSGDIFSAEDHLGTWKTVLTRSRSRGELYAGKLLAAVTYTVAMLAVLAGASVVAGVALGTQPVVGLSGQLVPAGQAASLVVASWATQLPPLLGFCALAVLVSVVTRNSPLGIGGPVVIGLVMQLTSLVNLPSTVRAVLLSTPFGSWHGFWVQDPFLAPLRHGLITSAVWFVVCATASWLVFRHRNIGVT